jgi:cyclohexa-1,5-dienecarbonyl-CoA hydratase
MHAAAPRHLRVERRPDGVAVVVLDHPNKPVNTLSAVLLEEFEAAVAPLLDDPSVVALVGASAKPDTFIAGADLELVEGMNEAEASRLSREGNALLSRIAASPKPIVAAVHGAALGGGCELALACDMVLARDDLKLGQPEIQLAVFPPVAAALLPQLIGRQRALDLILTGRTIGAAEALRMGLVSRVLSTVEFEAGAAAALAELASRSGPALRLAKRAVLDGMDLPFAPALQRAEDLYLNELMQLADVHEGLAAFMEKRAPVWEDPA